MIRTLVVVGFGMAAHRLLDRLCAEDSGHSWRVVVLSEEPRPAYNRIALSSYLAGCEAGALSLPSGAILGSPRVDVQLGRAAVRLDRARRTVTADDGTAYPYDALVLATGARASVPPVPGHDLPGCFTYRSLADADAIRAAAAFSPGGGAVVVGGGLLGLEAADGLRRLGLGPHVVERAPHLMPAQLDADGARLVERLVGAAGLRAYCGRPLLAVEPYRRGLLRVRLADATVLDAALVVFSSGVRPRDELAAAAGLATAERGGCLVDAACRTEDPRIFAIGDCAAVEGRSYGLVTPGYRMADAVAGQLLGRPEVFTYSGPVTRLKLPGVDVAGFGDTHALTPGALQISYRKRQAGHHIYAKIVLDKAAETLLGGILVGGAAARSPLPALLGQKLPSPVEELLP
ncbi:NAD(P)/FAD-dependent oxidoreductase [Streptomyces celluloflavus]|uniref:NAD(P)/FAD-dependent oxidoreductase n=1 Tax=Streptomyces celluloflavus TaxID=58344 RepID=UPI00364A58CC